VSDYILHIRTCHSSLMKAGNHKLLAAGENEMNKLGEIVNTVKTMFCLQYVYT